MATNQVGYNQRQLSLTLSACASVTVVIFVSTCASVSVTTLAATCTYLVYTLKQGTVKLPVSFSTHNNYIVWISLKMLCSEVITTFADHSAFFASSQTFDGQNIQQWLLFKISSAQV